MGIVNDSSAPVEKDAPAELPDQFGRYTLRRKLGQGAMGVVYLAKDAELERLVAIKVPQFGRGAEAAIVERFQREVRSAAAITHPNICPIYDVDEVDGTLLMTMAYIEGRTLSSYVTPERSLSITQTVSMARKLALALQAAHQRGIIHRDLKPANIMIDRRGEPIIMDFGLACRRSEDDADPTRRGARVGTPSYMSPEQVAGIEATVASDQYSLGVVLFELLTHRVPFEGELGDLLAKIANDDPPAPSQLNPEIPAALDEICLRALQKEPEDRFDTLDDFACDLTRFLVSNHAQLRGQHHSGAADDDWDTDNHTAEASGDDSRPRTKRFPMPAAIAVGVALILVVLAGLGLRKPSQKAASRDAALVAASDVELVLEESATIEPIETPASAPNSADNPVVNTLLGRYLCFSEKDWKQGAKYLAEGDDESLKQIAKQELAALQAESTAIKAESLRLADAWRELAAQQQSRETRSAMEERAAFWYESVNDSLSGAERNRVDQWLAIHAQQATEPNANVGSGYVPPPTQVAARGSTEAPLTASLPLDVGAPPSTARSDIEPPAADAGLPLDDPFRESAPPRIDIDAKLADPFAEQHRLALLEIGKQRREMLAEMRDRFADRDQRLPAEYVKAEGEIARVTRLRMEKSEEYKEASRRLGELTRWKAMTSDIRDRVDFDYRHEIARRKHVAIARGLNALGKELQGHRQTQRDLEAKLEKVHGELLRLARAAERLVVDAFWSSEPTGSLSEEEYDAVAVIITSWHNEQPVHPAILALRALARFNQGDFESAKSDAQQAVLLDSSFPFTIAIKGYVACRTGDAAGIADITRAIRLDSKQPYGYLLRGLAHRALGQHDSALEDLARVARMSEDVAWGHALQARQLAAAPVAKIRNGAEAVTAAEQSYRLTKGRSWFCLDALAMAYAEAGRFPEAVTTQRRAIALTPVRFREGSASRLALFEENAPYRMD